MKNMISTGFELRSEAEDGVKVTGSDRTGVQSGV